METEQEIVEQSVAPNGAESAVAQQTQPEVAKDKSPLLFMDASGISMRVIPKQLIETYGLEETTGEKGMTYDEINSHSTPNKEPRVEGAQVATFNIEYLLKFLKLVDKRVSKYITLHVKTGEPLLMTAKGEATHGEELRMWLAPYCED